ncbi:MAG: hypothetical protein PHS54_01360 [Clostridia bacterium]|nr:hypothetical protein [Clostridia bacterium]
MEGKKTIDSNWQNYYEDISEIRKRVYSLLTLIYDPYHLKNAIIELAKSYKTLIISLSPYIEKPRFNILQEKINKTLKETQEYLFYLEYLKTNVVEFPPSKEIYDNLEKIILELNLILDELGFLARTMNSENNLENTKIKGWLIDNDKPRS